MSRKGITDQQKCDILMRLKCGESIRSVAKSLGISTTTVQKYKKCLPESVYAGSDSGDNDDLIDYSAFLTKSEQQYVKKLKQEIALYEDEKEGWAYHLTQNDYRLKTSGLWWNAIAYLDCLPEDWKERLRRTGFQIAISPLHNMDWWDHDSPEKVNPKTGEVIEKGARYKVGDKKKPHYHIIVKCEKRMGYKEMNDILQRILNCPYIQKCNSLRYSYDYFLHVNAPNKYQGYREADIERLNGFYAEPTNTEKTHMITVIGQTIIDKKISCVSDLFLEFQDKEEYLALIYTKPYVLQAMMEENWREQNPDSYKKNSVRK